MIERRKFRTKQAKKRERIRLVVQIVFSILAILVLFGVFSYLSQLDYLRIKSLHVQTDGVLERTELAAIIESELDGKFFGLIPKDSALVVSHDHIETAIKDTFPRAYEVILKRSSFYDLSADVHERTPEALWCGDVVPSIAYKETSDEVRTSDDLWGSCYLVDKQGFIYSRAPLFSGNVFPRYYGILENAEPIAQQYLPTDEFLGWQRFYLTLRDNGVTPQALLFVDERDIELYLTNGLKILVPREEDTDLIIRRLLAVLESETIDENKEVEYVDLRFGNKAFVKYYGEKVENE